ncbi:DUF3592 domain-containing protein [Streptomyces ehimensis]|uniref:DUF3592 domain-containing protein n=1 Tax=Streptomyces ehimensis TaxID=68195 RepID=A0ABV9BW89_9ACTN
MLDGYAGLSAAFWMVLLWGACWVTLGLALAVSDMRAHRRGVTVSARCKFVNRHPDGEVRHLLHRNPVGGEGKEVLLLSDRVVVKEGRDVTITYDPKEPGRIFVGEELPKLPHLKAACFFIALGLSAFIWGPFI